jgi:excinuclease ABC subunit C
MDGEMTNPALAFRPDPGTVPTEPGCYLWRDAADRVVYVGKAKNVRARLASYFGAWSGIGQRTRAMLDVARSVEWIVTASEVAALHLEYNLIKRHRPRYNVRYNDDKSYPYLAITVQDDVPRATVRRNPRKDGTRYFGPYAHAYAIRETLDLLLRVFPVRTCSQGVYDRCVRSGRPCLLYHIGRCAAPCVGKVTPEEHRELVEGLMGFLEGGTAETIDELERRMTEEAAKLNFEAAARIRDQLAAVRKALERQQMVTGRREDFDAVHFHSDDLEAAFQAFFVRRGRVVGRKGWTADRVEDLDDAALLSRFLLELAMERAETLPREVLVPIEPDDRETLEELFTELRTDAGRPGRVRIRVPQRGDKRATLETVRENAAEAFQQHRLRRSKDFNARSQALRELQEGLGLSQPPLRIECYDISTLQGTNSVASMVVMEDGLPRKSEYRRFKIRGVEGQDDFAMMHEVITRRFRRLLEEQGRPLVDEAGDGKASRKFAYPPNLVIIDGGKGQLSAARRALEELEVGGVEVCALAKRLEEVYLPGRRDAVRLPRGSEALFLLQRVRDEAHRFAVTYHRNLRGRSMTRSAFDEIPGVGPARRRALLAHFGSLKRVRAASVEELEGVQGISTATARAIHGHLHPGLRESGAP